MAIKSSKELAKILREIADTVEENKSFSGVISYTLKGPDKIEVKGRYNVEEGEKNLVSKEIS